MTQDPHRLSDDPAEPELARALRDAQGDVLSLDAVARVQAALAAAGIAAAGPGGLGAGPRSPAKLLTGPARLWIGLACLGLAGVAGVASVRPVTMGGPERAPAVTMGGPERAPHPPPVTPSAPPEQAAATAGAAAVSATPAPPEPQARPVTTEEPSRSPPRPVTMGETPRPPTAVALPSPREGALLLEARRALGTDPARALTLVRAHQQEFPASQLGPERARIAAEARQRLEK